MNAVSTHTPPLYPFRRVQHNSAAEKRYHTFASSSTPASPSAPANTDPLRTQEALLFELSYVVAVKERAWRRLAVLACLLGLSAGWLGAHMFSPSLNVPVTAQQASAASNRPASSPTTNISALPDTKLRSTN